MSNIVIKLENVSKFYKLYSSPKVRLKEALHPFGKKYHKEFFALKNINLEVEKGEVLGIVGRNGSGKSTLLKLIANVMVPSSGHVSVAGKINALLELTSGLNPSFTGLENIYFMGSINGFKKEEMEDKVKEIMKFSELGDFINQPLRSYSSGMKSRLAFSIATTITPEILILDEVLSVGDALFRRKSFARMEKLISENRTVLFVSHNEQSVKSICTKAILLDKGKLMYSGNPDETVNFYLELLHGKKKVISDNSKKVNIQNTIIDKNKNIDKVDKKFISSSKSKKYVKIYSADINDICVYPINSSEPVSILVQGENYRLRCTVNLDNCYENVSLAMTIKNDHGIILSGISPRLAGLSVNNKDKEKSLIFEYTFNCLLNPSVYFIDVSLNGDVDNVNEVLCYIVDSISLKVTSNTRDASMHFGFSRLFDLNSKCNSGPVANYTSI